MDELVTLEAEFETYRAYGGWNFFIAWDVPAEHVEDGRPQKAIKAMSLICMREFERIEKLYGEWGMAMLWQASARWNATGQQLRRLEDSGKADEAIMADHAAADPMLPIEVLFFKALEAECPPLTKFPPNIALSAFTDEAKAAAAGSTRPTTH